MVMSQPESSVEIVSNLKYLYTLPSKIVLSLGKTNVVS